MGNCGRRETRLMISRGRVRWGRRACRELPQGQMNERVRGGGSRHWQGREGAVPGAKGTLDDSTGNA